MLNFYSRKFTTFSLGKKIKIKPTYQIQVYLWVFEISFDSDGNVDWVLHFFFLIVFQKKQHSLQLILILEIK